MNWITVTWTMDASACLTIALIYLVIWFNDRKSHPHLLFAVTAFAVAAIAAGELQMMFAQTPEQFGRWLRWTYVPLSVAVVSAVWFVRFYLQAGRAWLAWLVSGLRVLALALNFAFAPNLNFREITSLRHIEMLGGVTVAVPQGELSQRTRVDELASLFLFVFIVDASISLWRRGTGAERRRAVVIGGSLAVFVLAGAGHVTMIHAGFIQWPYMISLTFLFPIMAMGYELGIDVVRSVQLTRQLDLSQSQLREIELRLGVVAAITELGIWRWDVVRDEIWVSDNTRAALGIDGAPKVNLTRFLTALAAEDRDEVRQTLMQSLSTGSGYEKEFRVRLRGGVTRWIAARGTVELNGSGMPIAMRGVSFDITRRKQADERFRVVVDAAPNSILLVNPNGYITLVNKQTEAVFGYDRDELIGQPIEILVPTALRSTHMNSREEYIAAPQARSMGAGRELFGQRKDGSAVPVEIRLSPIQTSEGMLILTSIIDVSERKQAERDQVRQRNELAHLSRVAMLGELSGSLAHELNQPLTAILSNAQAAQQFLSQDSNNLDDVRGILQDIVHEDRRAREIIRRLRLLFRKGEIQFEALDLNDLVLEVLRLMNSDLVNHGVTARANLMPDLPRIKGDVVQLQQVLINLIVNASDAMSDNDDDDREFRVTTCLSQNGAVELSVDDDGCGIPSDQMEKVFEPFRTTKEKGMGLGLAVCRTIVTAHGGELWATNNLKRGACFHIAFLNGNAGYP